MLSDARNASQGDFAKDPGVIVAGGLATDLCWEAGKQALSAFGTPKGHNGIFDMY